MKHLSLQLRITIMAAFVLTLSSIALTLISMVNAQNSFVALFEENFATQMVDSIDTSHALDQSIPGIAATPAIQAKKQFDTNSLIVCGLVIAIGSALTYVMAGKALKPLRDLTLATQNIDASHLSNRLNEVDCHDEVNQLTQSFNSMLARLENSFEKQERFTANAAHELKTPLATLKTSVQVLQHDPTANLTDYQENATYILDNVNRLSLIVDDLLLLASSNQRRPNALETVQIIPLIDAILYELEPTLSKQAMQIKMNIPDLSLLSDASLLYRALYNIIENACKYCPNRSIIELSAAQKENTIQLTIKDNGPGIDKHHLPYIFDAFYRVDKSRTRQFGGSGLGLSIVKAIIESLNGSINVSSDGKTYTEFIILLVNNN